MAPRHGDPTPNSDSNRLRCQSRAAARVYNGTKNPAAATCDETQLQWQQLSQLVATYCCTSRAAALHLKHAAHEPTKCLCCKHQPGHTNQLKQLGCSGQTPRLPITCGFWTLLYLLTLHPNLGSTTFLAAQAVYYYYRCTILLHPYCMQLHCRSPDNSAVAVPTHDSHGWCGPASAAPTPSQVCPAINQSIESINCNT